MFLDFKQKFKRESEILKGPNILGNLPPPPGNEIPMNINLVQKGGGQFPRRGRMYCDTEKSLSSAPLFRTDKIKQLNAVFCWWWSL